MTEVNAIFAISYRDLLKFLRDPLRIAATLIFPFVFIAIMGGTMANSFGTGSGFDYMSFIFTGVFGQTLFQSTAMGIISLIEDRENDFSQEIFVSPISRYSIIFGKIMGETLVSFSQGLAIILMGILLGIPLTLLQLAGLLVVGIVASLLGGALGVVLMANIKSQRAANQIFPFIMLPQYFLAGVFTPIQGLPPYLDIVSRISPMRYAIDLVRGIYYTGQPEFSSVVLESPLYNLAVLAALFSIFLFVGTYLFVRGERNR